MTVTQDAFVASRQVEWDELDYMLHDGKALHRMSGTSISRAALLYRSVCTDLMRARAAGYGAGLCAFLDALAGRAHNALYTAPPYRLGAIWELCARDFPVTLRRRAGFLLCSAALFVLPFVVGLVGAWSTPRFAQVVLPESMLSQMAEAYAKGFADGRDPGVNATMAGFYVYNNVGIAFRCFATGILFGLGSVFFLVYNGLVIGTVLGYVAQTGHGVNILTFCAGHSPFELTAIVISGAAGLQMGYALVDTRGQSRWGSLRAQSQEIATLVLGAALMLGIAAGIEGFWSPSAVPALVKWIVASALAVLVTTYFVFAGRRP
jgi:uncharacterized membrane protein SpoIIM required for sporulation